jgi:diguanylate cyclase (GGDEF)-like protein/PAS domain S-box-containing protein
MSIVSTLDAGFRDIFENSGSVMLLVEPSCGRIVEANRAALSYYGYPREQLIGASFNEINILDWEETARKRRRSRYPGRKNFAFRHRLASGEERDVEVSFSPIDSKQGPLVFSIVHDVTGLRQPQAELRSSETIYRSVFQTSLDAVSISRVSDGVYIDVNQSFVDALGYRRDEVIGRTPSELNIWVSFDARDPFEKDLSRKSYQRTAEVKLRKRNREIFWGLASISDVEIEGVRYLVSVLKDISDVKRAEERIRSLAFYDPLTGLPNRRLLLDRLQHSMAAAGRDRKQALLLVHIDNLRTFNDTLGHKMGDLMLKEIARRLTACTRETDIVARSGGAEFAVLVEDLSARREEAAAQVQAIAKKVQATIGQSCMLAGHECLTSSSIGISVFGTRMKNAVGVLQRAQIAMSQARNAGRNRISFFSTAMQALIVARAAIEEELRNAIKTDQLVLFYQPQVVGQHLVGAEVLLRWRHPKRGLLPPGEFIPLAEESGLIVPLGEWVLDRVFAQAAAWERSSTKCFTISVNISPYQFQHPDFVTQVMAALDRTKANPQKIKLELTESLFMDNVKEAVAKMSRLKSRGLRFSMDDFGTGYSSLSYVKNLPLDELKIDRSFVKDILVDSSSGAIARTIISLGRAMGLSVIAEGVESEEQKQFLAQLGCEAFQGFLIGRPAALQDFEQAWLA